MFSPHYLQTEQVPTAWIWYLLLAVLVLLLIFWWLNRSPRREVAPEEPREMAQPQREQTADDLKRIEGIGPKVEKVLKEASITTFDALARANVADVQQTLNAAGLQMMNPEGWIDQAKLAARGDWNGLEQLQNELKGGRKK
jgi:sensor histidine kinase regulating citrate/malate metabolism